MQACQAKTKTQTGSDHHIGQGWVDVGVHYCPMGDSGEVWRGAILSTVTSSSNG